MADLASAFACHRAGLRSRLGKSALVLGLAVTAAILPQSDLWAASSPARCPVNFSVQSISLTDWEESGLGSWTADTYPRVQLPENFDTPDAIFGIYDTIIAFDHYQHQIILMSNVQVDPSCELEKLFIQTTDLLTHAQVSLITWVPREITDPFHVIPRPFISK